MSAEQIKKLVKKLPAGPGIYIFKDNNNKPLYIGKASNLKKRVNSYLKLIVPKVAITTFGTIETTPAELHRLQKMILESASLSYIKTDSDIEALILESQYIKKYQPPFNIMMRDDKQYAFVGFTEEEYPKVFITHQPIKIKNSKGKIQNFNSKLKNLETRNWQLKTDYIGPFTDVGALKATLRLLRRIFPYCTCRQLHNNYCLNYHINKCHGFCCLKQQNPNLKFKIKNLKLYEKNIRAIKNILSGKRKSLINNFEKEMKKLAKKEKFEEAMNLQFKINKLKRIFKNAQIINKRQEVMIYHNPTRDIKSLQKLLKLPSLPHRIEAYDVANIQGQYAVGAMAVFTNGKSDKNKYRKFKIRNLLTSQVGTTCDVGTLGDTGMLREVLTRRFNHPEWPYPDLIVVDGGKAQLNTALSVLATLHPPHSTFIVSVTKNEKHIGEKIYIAGQKNPIPLSELPPSVKNFLLRINSEAHRFAISYYRKLHGNKINSQIFSQRSKQLSIP